MGKSAKKSKAAKDTKKSWFFENCESCDKWMKAPECQGKAASYVCANWEEKKEEVKTVEVDPGGEVTVIETKKPSEILKNCSTVQEMADALNIKLSSLDVMTSTDSTPKQILKGQLHVALNIIQLAELSYRRFSSSANAYAVAKVIETVQTLVRDIQNFQDPMKLFREIEDKVMKPVTKDYLEVLTSELSTLKTSLIQSMPTDKVETANRLFKNFFEGITVESQTRYKTRREDLMKILDVTY